MMIHSDTNKNSARRLGVCALCNFNEWVVPNEEGRSVCEDTETCALQQMRNHEVAIRAEWILEVLSFCDTHLKMAWSLQHEKGGDDKPNCPRCVEAKYAEEMSQVWADEEEEYWNQRDLEDEEEE
jgi:hypothetical protein